MRETEKDRVAMNVINIEEMILFEDKDIFVCRKPAGFPVQSKRLGSMDMESALKTYRVRKGEKPYIGVIHRLGSAGARAFGVCKKSGECWKS